jgi:hypothetical protein
MSQAPATEFVESDNEFFQMSGPMPTAWDEHRRHPRFYFRSCAEAFIHPLRGQLDPNAPPCFLVTRDLSRGGVSLIHTEQLFPGQRLDLILNGEPPRASEVVWCRRWGNDRFAVGCRFVRVETDETPAAGAES